MDDEVIKVGDCYRFIYDDKGKKPVVKVGTVILKEEGLIKLDSGEILNRAYIIRAEGWG